jgi:hypothetical protein
MNDPQSQVDLRQERVLLQTDRQRIVGLVTLPPEGYQSRFSDFLNRTDVAFLPLVDVEITPLDGGEGLLFHLAALQRCDLHVDERQEGDVGAIQEVGEAALVALRRQGHEADDPLPIGLEEDSLLA